MTITNNDNVATMNISKLNTQNFPPWKRQITIILKLEALYHAIIDENVDEVTDMQATMISLNAMDDAHRIQVQAENTAKTIMSSLERQYHDTSAASKHRLISEFFTTKKDQNMIINQHVAMLKEKRASLANMKETVSDELFQVIIINSLPLDYGDVLKEWEMVHPGMKNVEFLLNILQSRDRGSKESEQIMVARNLQTPRPSLSWAGKMKRYPCLNCKGKGHWARDCPQGSEDINIKQSEDPKEDIKITANMILNMGEIGNDLRQKWLADSGATSTWQTTKHSSLILNIILYPNLPQLMTARRYRY